MRTRPRLLLKVLGIHAALLVAALVAAWLAVDYLAADSFMTLMEQFDIDPAEVEAMFRSATRNALIQVGLVALGGTILFDVWITRRILRPLDELAAGSSRIAAGDYGHRIGPRRGARDELHGLIEDFDRMAASLERTERARKAMVVDVAHELRTPLTNLRGTVEAMQDGLLRLDEPALAALHDELLRLIRLTERLITAARADSAAGGDLRLEDSDVGALLAQTAETFRARLRQRSLELRLRLERLPPTLPVDVDRMTQVFANLLDNAVRFAPAGSAILVRGETRGDRVRITVENRGAPSTPQHLEHVFDPYVRLDTSRSRELGGAGLGLAIVKGIVDRHGGRVGAESSEGVFRVWLELAVRPPGFTQT